MGILKFQNWLNISFWLLSLSNIVIVTTATNISLEIPIENRFKLDRHQPIKTHLHELLNPSK